MLQEDIEAWSWSDRALLLQILTESVARSRKLREHNDSEREIRMDLSDSKSASEHMWTRTGSALLGVDRHHNEYWAFGSSTPLVFSRLKESGTWAVYNDSEPLLAHFSSAGLRESFLRKKLLAHRTRQNAGKATMRSLLQKSVLEQPLFSRTGRLSVLACFEHCGDSDASQQKVAMNTLAKHSVHVRGTPYLEAMQERFVPPSPPPPCTPLLLMLTFEIVFWFLPPQTADLLSTNAKLIPGRMSITVHWRAPTSRQTRRVERSAPQCHLDGVLISVCLPTCGIVCRPFHAHAHV